jgi:hypothetical protein
MEDENLTDPRDMQIIQVSKDLQLQQALGGVLVITRSQISALLQWFVVFDSLDWPEGAKQSLQTLQITQKMKGLPP